MVRFTAIDAKYIPPLYGQKRKSTILLGIAQIAVDY
jgi:hypothetical protein